MQVTGALALLLAQVSTTVARCYNLAGTAPVDSSFVPCDPDAEISACCASNKAQPDICLQGGLCYATMGSYSGYIYGNGCTDVTGEGDACPFACPAKANGWKSYNVLQCTLGTWCCREASDTTNCCNNSSMLISGSATSYLGRFINNAAPVSASTSNSSSTATTNATATETATITATASNGSGSKNTTTVVGAAVGAVLGVVCIIALAGMLWMMRKVRTLKKEVQSLKKDPYPSLDAVMSSQQAYHVPQSTPPMAHAYEADWNNGRYEIDGTGK